MMFGPPPPNDSQTLIILKTPQKRRTFQCDLLLSNSSSLSRCVSPDDLKRPCWFCPGAGGDLGPFENALQRLLLSASLLMESAGVNVVFLLSSFCSHVFPVHQHGIIPAKALWKKAAQSPEMYLLIRPISFFFL